MVLYVRASSEENRSQLCIQSTRITCNLAPASSTTQQHTHSNPHRHAKWHIKSDFNFLVHSKTFNPCVAPRTHPPIPTMLQTNMKTYYHIACTECSGAYMNIDTEIYLFILFSLLCCRTTTITISRILIVVGEQNWNPTNRTHYCCCLYI